MRIKKLWYHPYYDDESLTYQLLNKVGLFWYYYIFRITLHYLYLCFFVKRSLEYNLSMLIRCDSCRYGWNGYDSCFTLKTWDEYLECRAYGFIDWTPLTKELCKGCGVFGMSVDGILRCCKHSEPCWKKDDRVDQLKSYLK